VPKSRTRAHEQPSLRAWARRSMSGGSCAWAPTAHRPVSTPDKRGENRRVIVAASTVAIVAIAAAVIVVALLA
jgi:hypothetical protein